MRYALARFSPSTWLPYLWSTFARFPAPATVSFVTFLLLIFDESGRINLDVADEQRTYATAVAAFLVSVGMHLFAESRAWPAAWNAGVAFAAAVMIAALGYFHVGLQLEFSFLVYAAILWVMVAAHLKKGITFNSFWQFNLRLVVAATAAVIVGLISLAAIYGILLSIDRPYGVGLFPHDPRFVFYFSTYVVCPLFGLSLICVSPHDKLEIAEHLDDQLKRGISVLVNYILVPSLLVYGAILYFYIGLIVLQMSMADGMIGFMVLAYGLGGIATWLIAKPWEEKGTILVRAFVRWFFWSLPIPTILLVLALYERVAAFGLTQSRVALGLYGLWLIFIICYFAIRRARMRPQLILVPLAIMLGIFSFGPWGARALSVNSQMARLETLLRDAKLLHDGKLKLPEKGSEKLAPGIWENGGSILRFLHNNNYWTGSQVQTAYGDLLSDFFFRYDGRGSRVYFQSAVSITHILQEKGALLHGPVFVTRDKPKSSDGRFVLKITRDRLTIEDSERKHLWSYSWQEVLKRADQSKKNQYGHLTLTLREASGGPTANFYVWQAVGYLYGPDKGLEKLTGMLLISGQNSD